MGDDKSSGKEYLFSAKFACPVCNYSLQELEPRLFSFNNPMGACPTCDGLGVIEYFDPKRVVAFPHMSLGSGAIKGWDRRNQFYFAMLESRRALRLRSRQAVRGNCPEDRQRDPLWQRRRNRVPVHQRAWPDERPQHAFEGSFRTSSAVIARPIRSWSARSWRST
jgi:excinuclease ABC subunit A